MSLLPFSDDKMYLSVMKYRSQLSTNVSTKDPVQQGGGVSLASVSMGKEISKWTFTGRNAISKLPISLLNAQLNQDVFNILQTIKSVWKREICLDLLQEVPRILKQRDIKSSL